MKVERRRWTVDMSPYHRENAQAFRDSNLNGGQRLLLEEELAKNLKTGAFTRWLRLVKDEAKRVRVSQEEIGRQLLVTRNAVCNWFSDHETMPSNVNTWLLHRVHDRFIDLSFDASLRSAAARTAITWVRMVVLEDEACHERLRADEFEFLYHHHQNGAAEDKDGRLAFAGLPQELKMEYPGRDAEWFNDVRRGWQVACGQFLLELDGDEIWL